MRLEALESFGRLELVAGKITVNKEIVKESVSQINTLLTETTDKVSNYFFRLYVDIRLAHHLPLSQQIYFYTYVSLEF